MRSQMAVAWVVYSAPTRGCPAGTRAVCEQSEWEALVRAKPGFHTLVRAGITNEGAAGEVRTRSTSRRLTTWPNEVAEALTRPDVPAAV
jgi:hypothetical protein